MKIAMLFLLAAGLMFGQTANVAAVGVSVNPSASPKVAGTGLYAKLVSGDGTYLFTIIDALPASAKPFTVTTNVGGGVAQKVATIQGVPVYVPTSVGVSWTGKNLGWSWNTGGMAVIKVKGEVRIMPNVRVLKSSISGADTGYQVIGGVLFGWGW